MSQGLSTGLELILLALARGSLYALIAVGFSLVFGVGRILNLFHGGFFLLGCYLAFVVSRALGVGGGFLTNATVTLLTALMVGGIGWIYYQLLLRPFAGRALHALALGLVANLVLAQLLRSAWGTRPAVVEPILAGSFRFGSAQVLWQEILLIAVAAGVFPALRGFLRHGRVGLAIRAVAQDPKGAALVGIRSDRVLAVTVALSAALAGLAGALVAPVRVVSPELWTFALLKSFTVVILGGVGSLWGALLASFAIGATEVVVTSLTGETTAELVTVAIALVALLLRPRGLSNEPSW